MSRSPQLGLSEQTTVIISHLSKGDFVASPGKQLSLANQIKLALLNLATDITGHELYQDIINWSNLPFLNRIIVIFNNGASAALAYDYLEKLYRQEKPFTLPATAKLSLQENLLRRSKLSDALTENNALELVQNLKKFKSTYGEEDYKEPEPKHFDTYEDLMKLGIDVTKLNSTELFTAPALSRSASATKTLFRPKLELSTAGMGGSIPPASPTITLDELA